MSLQYNTDAIVEGRKRARRVRMDKNGSEQAQYAWISVIERGVYRKKPQPRTWEFYMKLGNTLRAIESSQGCWNERRAGCATMKPWVCCHLPHGARAATVSTHEPHLAAFKTASCWDLQSEVSGSIFIERRLAICVITHVSRCHHETVKKPQKCCRQSPGKIVP